MSFAAKIGARFASRRNGRSTLSTSFSGARRFFATEDSEKDATSTGSSADEAKAGPSAKKVAEPPLFKTNESPWDLVFQGIDEMAPPISSSSAGLTFPRKPRDHPSLSSSYPSPEHSRQPTGTSTMTGNQTRRPARRQSMTTREINAFDHMFSLIFDAVAEQKPLAASSSSGIGARRRAAGFTVDGKAGAAAGEADATAMDDDPLSQLYGKFRRRVGRMVKEDERLLDRKREQVELCATDHELLEWAMRELFDESVKYEHAARAALEAASPSSSTGTTTTATPPPPAGPLPSLQPPCYAALLAHLMRTFREKYRDPHTALSLFAHAQRLSIASYVFGCTTPAYNELLETRWACFRDLRGVADALAEMRVNGVQPDGRTRALAEEVRREVGARNLWQEEGALGLGGGAGANESVFELLQKIEELSFRENSASRRDRGDGMYNRRTDRSSPRGRGRGFGLKRWTAASESWKNSASSKDNEGANDDYEFGDWSFDTQKRTNDRF